MNRYLQTIGVVLLAAALAGCATGGGKGVFKFGNQKKAAVKAPSGIPTGFLDRVVKTEDGFRRYVVYVPYEYDPKQPWPLILFLHGAGERGDDGLAQSAIGIGQAIRLHPERFPAIVVMPQCPKDVWWDRCLDDVAMALEQTRAEYNTDPNRIYLTGLSMGGYGTWIYGALEIDTFAALMPICGGGKVEDAPTLAKVPIWAFHGGADETVKPEESRKMVEAVKKAGGEVKYTEYKGVGHNSWDEAYGDPKAIAWLLSQQK